MKEDNYYRKLLELLTGMSSEDYAKYLLKCIDEQQADNFKVKAQKGAIG